MADPTLHQTTAFEKIAEGLKDAAEGNYAVRQTSDLQARLVNALLAERDDPRNRCEHTGFYAGMTRAITVVRMEMEKLNAQP